jgi:UDP-glucuronate 4-epimerase
MIAMTGASGYLGARVRALLMERNRSVHRFGRRDAESIVDLTRSEPAWEEIDNEPPTVLLHSAGVMSVDEASAIDSTRMAANLLASVPASVRRLVLVSSAYVHAPSKDVIRESDLARPADVYGNTKLAVEALFEAFARATNRSLIILRPCAIYGPNDPHQKAITKFVSLAMKNEAPTLKGAVTFARDYIHVVDAARATILALDLLPREDAAVSVFNVCTGSAWTAIDVARMIGEIRPLARVKDEELKGQADAIGYRFDPTLATRDLGFTAQIDLRTALTSMLESKPT